MTIQKMIAKVTAVERATSTTPESDGASRMLVATLAKLDALFFPWRQQGDFRGAISATQRSHFEGKYAIAARGSGFEQWKSAANERAELQRAGLAKIVTAKSQAVGLKLTAEGLSVARGLVGAIESIALGIAMLKAAEAKWRNKYCSESDLFGTQLVGDSSQWEQLTEFMLPSLIAGCVFANSDCDGRVYYRLQHEDYVEPPAHERREPEQWAIDCYLEAFATERVALSKLENTDGGLVIPMPRGGW